MKIKHVFAREIYDSRGWPTVECELILQNGVSVKAAAPNGLSVGAHEAVTLIDHEERLMGRGMRKAIQNIEQKIAPLLIDQDPNIVVIDGEMIDLDGSDDKSVLGANAMIAVSMAVCKAQAACEELELYELLACLCDFDTISLPVPMVNLINGGMHADSLLVIQEFMVVPMGMQTFAQAMEACVTVFYQLREMLRRQNKRITFGDEGGFSLDGISDIDALEYLTKAINMAQKQCNGSLMIALDVAASHFYNKQYKTYNFQGKAIMSEELIAWYEQIVEKYPIYSIEDALAEDDWSQWETLTQHFKSKVRIVGDDIFATHSSRIEKGIQKKVADSVIIKPNQVGTITETLQAIKLCKDYGLNTIISHRSGETNDTFIADLAVGVSANHIKAGSCSRGERVAKYNRLLRIEDSLLRP